MEKLFVYIDTDLENVPTGTYPVISTNERYDSIPTVATIQVGDKEEKVYISRYDWGGTGPQLLWDDKLSQILEDASKYSAEEANDHLNGLHHCEYTVEEFIQEFGGGDVHAALKIAIRTDWDAMPTKSKSAMDLFVAKAMCNRSV